MNTPQNHPEDVESAPPLPNTPSASNTQGPAANAGNIDATTTDGQTENAFNPAIQGSRMRDLH